MEAPLTHLTEKYIDGGKWNEDFDVKIVRMYSKRWKKPSPKSLVTPDWEMSFRGHVDASQFAGERLLTQLDENGKDCIVSFYYKSYLSQKEITQLMIGRFSVWYLSFRVLDVILKVDRSRL